MKRDFVILGIPLAILLYLVHQWSTLANWAGQRNWWEIYWNALSTYGLDFWLGKRSILRPGESVSFGSAGMLHYVIYAYPILVGIFVAQWFLGKRKGEKIEGYLWTNGAWLILTFIIMGIAISVATTAHYMDAYTIREAVLASTGETVKIVPIEGRADDTTHTWTPAMIQAMIQNVNIMKIANRFGAQWYGRSGRLKEAGTQFLAGQVLVWFWEDAEFGNPAKYTNPPNNSLSDIQFGTLGILLIILAYNAMVKYEDEPRELSQ